MSLYEEEILRILEDNADKRICVIGTTCTGKSTIINNIGVGIDMDSEIFPLLTKEETDYVCSSPWTEEIGNKMDELVRERLSIKKGVPMFGTVLLDCDLIIYLHISDELLKKRCALRGADFINAKNMQKKISDEINVSTIETFTVDVLEDIKELGKVR